MVVGQDISSLYIYISKRRRKIRTYRQSQEVRDQGQEVKKSFSRWDAEENFYHEDHEVQEDVNLYCL
jgi:hypothetical protein